MYRLHFTDKNVSYDDVITWFAMRNTSFSLMSKRAESPKFGANQWKVYDISVMNEDVALEFMLTFDAKFDESKLLKLRKERNEILRNLVQASIEINKQQQNIRKIIK